MRTQQLTSYKAFIAAGRPYLPTINAAGRLLLPNFNTAPSSYSISNKRRLAIRSGVIYNHGGLVCAYCMCISCVGYRWRWQYFVNGRAVSWYRLTWDQKRSVMGAWLRKHEALHIYYAPVKRWQRWVQ